MQANLRDDANRWDMAHYRDRIDTYYADGEQTLALEILDELATAETTLPLRELLDRLNVQGVGQELELVRKVLTLLGRDHYVAKQQDGSYGFKFSLIQRYWRMSRGL